MGIIATIYLLLSDKFKGRWVLYFILFFGWIGIGAIKQILSDNYYKQEYGGILFIDFIRSFGTYFAEYFTTLYCINKIGINRAGKYFFYAILTTVLASYLIFTSLTDTSVLDSLHSINFDYNDYFSWRWSQFLGLLALLIFFLHYYISNLNILLKIIIWVIVFFFSIKLESRFFIAILSLVAILINYKNIKINKIFGLISLITLITSFYLIIISNISSNIIQRFSSSFDEDEGRVNLTMDFLKNVNPYNFFGTLQSSSEITREEINSFHNIFFDSFWYSGYPGLFLTFTLVFYLIKNLYSSKSYKTVWAIILLGIIFGLPPFSDYIIISILIPFIIYNEKK